MEKQINFLNINRIMKEYQTIIDKDGKYIIIQPRILYEEYDLAHCDIPELHSMEATLEGIDRYYHHKLMGEFERLGCKMITLEVNDERLP